MTQAQQATKIVDKILGKKGKQTAVKSLQPDGALSAIVGSQAMSRAEMDKRLWAYIKKNGLQDKKHKQLVNADKKLKAVLGGRSQVSIFEVSKLVGSHLQGEAKP